MYRRLFGSYMKLLKIIEVGKIGRFQQSVWIFKSRPLTLKIQPPEMMPRRPWSTDFPMPLRELRFRIDSGDLEGNGRSPSGVLPLHYWQSYPNSKSGTTKFHLSGHVNVVTGSNLEFPRRDLKYLLTEPVDENMLCPSVAERLNVMGKLRGFYHCRQEYRELGG